MTGIEIATVVSIGLNLIGGFFLKRKAKAAKLLPVVIRGVEASAKGLESDPTLSIPQIQHAAKVVKHTIREAATAAGLEPALNKEVKRITRLVAYRR